MKILHLHIDQFRHLEDLKFDFTYPDDFHDESKRGKPLDKICIIGQSATGKTGILELIYGQIYRTQNITLKHNPNGLKFFNEESFNDFFGTFIFETKNKKIVYTNDALKINNTEYALSDSGKHSLNLFENSEKDDIYFFKSNLISDKNIEIFNHNPLELNEKYSNKIEKLRNLLRTKNIKKLNLIFDENISEDIFIFLLYEFLDFRIKFTQKMSELIHKGFLSDTKKLEKEYKKWEIENPNIIKTFSEKLNPLIHKLGLEIDMVNTEFPIPFRNIKTDEIISIDKLSTGTKGLLLSILPIYKLNTKDSIILIDEPERSLYPDIQMEIMEHYQNLAPEAQFIVATHSPFIAAAFEPEERFILEFNEEGKVVVRRGTSPIGDDPNDILYNDFGIDYINKYGKKAHEVYLEKKRKLLFEENLMEKEKLLNELESIGDKYNF